MKKILVPVDFSTHTGQVCRYALEIAKITGGEIRLFHAYFDFMISTNTAFPYTIETGEIFNQEMMFKIREEAKTDMQKLQSTMLKELEKEKIDNVRIVFTLTGGMPEEEILNVSETYIPDLIVLGTHGKGEKDILTGKVSSKVVQNATCRILTVPRDVKYHGFDNVLYATDLKGDDTAGLNTLIDLVSNYNPVIHCIHVDMENDPESGRARMEALRSDFSAGAAGKSIIFDVLSGNNFLTCVDDYILKNKIDLIAVVHHRKGFLRRLFTTNHTRQLLFHSSLPLYIFR